MFHGKFMLGLKLSADQLLENERTKCATAATLHGSVGGGASSRPVAAALPVWLHGRHASLHVGTDMLRTAAAAPALPGWRRSHVARHTLPGGDGTPCRAAHASQLPFSKARKTTTGNASDRATLPGLKCWFNERDRERETRRTKRSNFLKGPHKTKVLLFWRIWY